jgi:beta-glucosidase-like glycosyl hydrolase
MTSRHLSRTAIAAAVALTLALPTLPVFAAQADPAARAQGLLARMTLEEKAGQLQSTSPAIARLGIPAYNWWSEGLHGVARAGNATVFPQAIGLAATWNNALVERVADTVGTEFRAKYLETVHPDGGSDLYRGLTVWSPNVNIFRDPRWGRGQETYGEDPYLTARMGVAYIRGLQGADPGAPKVSATVKHFAVHSGPEADRHREDVHPSPRDLTETYLPAFHAAVTEGHVLSLMCAYNAVNGMPACANGPLLKDLLRDAWKFQGHVVSDCGAIADIHSEGAHRYVDTPERAVAAAIRTGTDVMCEFGDSPTATPATTVRAVKQGLLAEADVDRAVLRLLEARIRLGLLDKPQPFAGITAKDYDTPADRHLNLEAARQSLVLLKNDGLLPLKTAPHRRHRPECRQRRRAGRQLQRHAVEADHGAGRPARPLPAGAGFFRRRHGLGRAPAAGRAGGRDVPGRGLRPPGRQGGTVRQRRPDRHAECGRDGLAGGIPLGLAGAVRPQDLDALERLPARRRKRSAPPTPERRPGLSHPHRWTSRHGPVGHRLADVEHPGRTRGGQGLQDRDRGPAVGMGRRAETAMDASQLRRHGGAGSGARRRPRRVRGRPDVAARG